MARRRTRVDLLQPARDRLRARPLHRRPARRQACRRDRPQKPLAPPAALRGTARGGVAQEHPDDRADRLWQDRDLAPPRAPRAQAPFGKVQATKFPEGGYVGRDVGQDVRDLVEIAIGMTRERLRKEVEPKAELAAEERVLDALVGSNASADTRQKFRKRLREGAFDDREIEIAVQESAAANLPTFEIPGMPGAQMGMLNLGDIFGKAFGTRSKPKKMTVAESHRVLVAEESDKLLDQEMAVREAITAVEQNGIVFIDEIDKICGR